MISEMRPSAFNCDTAPSEKPVSSTRQALITGARRSCRPPARSSTAPRRRRRARPHRRTGRGRRRRQGSHNPGERLGRHQPADHPLAVIGLEAVDAHVLGRQAVPDRQQQAGDDMKLALGEFRHLAIRPPTAARNASRGPGASASGRIRRRSASRAPSDGQAGAGFDPPVVMHQAGGRAPARRRGATAR